MNENLKNQYSKVDNNVCEGTGAIIYQQKKNVY